MTMVWNTQEISRRIVLGRHRLFLKWLILIGIIVFVFTVAWHQGFLTQLYSSDRSYISSLITLLFIGFSVQCGVRTFMVSRQLDDAAQVSEILRHNLPHRFVLSQGRVRVGTGTALPDCVLGELIGDLTHKRDAGQDVQSLPVEKTELLDAYGRQIKGGHEIGWFVADAMIKLGLLGTVIGFIMMLGSVSNITTFDVSVMQDVLKAMSSGMGVALYTTLAGLVCGMLLALEYHFLERGSDDLIALMIKVVEVQVAPHLKVAPRAAT